jgi:cytochrome b pre-mRNA-processing protein 3
MPSPLEKLKRFFQPRPILRTGHALYSACVAQSRQPVFYTDYGVEDAIGARFELLIFHVGLVIHALKSLPAGDSRREQAQDTSQALFDTFIDALDNTLREQGTGDLTVPKKMKRLGETIYTRMKRWDELWATGGHADRADYAARTLFAGSAFDGEEGANDPTAGLLSQAAAFATYAEMARADLDVDAILNGKLDWCAIPDVAAESAGAA